MLKNGFYSKDKTKFNVSNCFFFIPITRIIIVNVKQITSVPSKTTASIDNIYAVGGRQLALAVPRHSVVYTAAARPSRRIFSGVQDLQ